MILRFFTPQGRHVAQIKVKFGVKYLGTLNMREMENAEKKMKHKITGVENASAYNGLLILKSCMGADRYARKQNKPTCIARRA